jgi:ferredoxin
MKVLADLDVCQGHARCQDCCPEVFGTDDFLGKVVLLMEEIPEPLQDNTRLAVRNCPEGALTLVDD